LAKHKEEHLDHTPSPTVARLQRTAETVHATQKRHTERPTTNSNTELTVRRSSRIAKRQNTDARAATLSPETKEATRKTPKKLRRHTQKRVHDKRSPDQTASNENVDITDSADRKYPKATPKTLLTSQSCNGSATKFSPKRPGTSRKSLLQKKFVRRMAAMKKKFVPLKLRQQNDTLYQKLKEHHDSLLNSVTNTTTEKISAEVELVVKDMAVMDDCDRPFQWTKDEESRLNELNASCKLLQPRQQWTWGALDDTSQGRYNDERMQFCLTDECSWKVIECPRCQSTGILVGLEQVESPYCYDCLLLERTRNKDSEKKEEAWEQVKPVSKEYPKRTESGHEDEDLPYLEPGDKAVIAPIHPVVTVKKKLLCQQKATPREYFVSSGPSSYMVKNSSEDFIGRSLYDY